ncbi:response regulator transcription factor [bacterium AH-315-K03]|nr:response regulator transcription factor [bacterium AH-315-K03]
MGSTEVILVENDIDLRHRLVESLTEQGINTTGVGSALEFYQKLSKQTFDVAVLEIGLPDHSGFSIVEYLKKESLLGVIILSTSQSSQDKIKAYELGADLYISKPVDSRELFLAISNLVARLTVSTQMTEDAGEAWVVDKESWRITAPCSYSVGLSAKEITFVSLLGEQAGSTIMRKTLLNALGYPNNQHGNRALESMVLRLRKKLSGCESGQIPVKTVHGAGYMFSFSLIMN